MFTLLFFCVFAIMFAEPYENYCCSKEQGFLMDNETVCFNETTNMTSAVNLQCKKTDTVSDAQADIWEFLNMIKTELENGMYCVSNETTAVSVVFCSEDIEEPIIEDHVLAICAFVSTIFLVPTVIIYIILPEIRNLQGKSIANLCGALAMALLLLGLIKTVRAPNMTSCGVQAIFVHFFFLAAFFWMNAISIQILQSIRRPTISDYGWKQFLWYALYAYGLPILLTMAMTIVNFHPGKHSKPGMGLNTCWFASKTQQWYYMYSVMSILILANICIFIYTSLHLCRGSYSSSNVRALRYKIISAIFLLTYANETSNQLIAYYTKNGKIKFVMSIRLLIIMGLPWIFEMISSLSPPHIIWVITDIINMMQGPLIFFVLVVLRRRVVKAMYKRGYLDCISGLVERYLAVGEDEENVVEHTTADGVEFQEK